MDKNPFNAVLVNSISSLEVFPPVFSHVHLSEAGKSSKSFRGVHWEHEV